MLLTADDGYDELAENIALNELAQLEEVPDLSWTIDEPFWTRQPTGIRPMYCGPRGCILCHEDDPLRLLVQGEANLNELQEWLSGQSYASFVEIIGEPVEGQSVDIVILTEDYQSSALSKWQAPDNLLIAGDHVIIPADTLLSDFADRILQQEVEGLSMSPDPEWSVEIETPFWNSQ